MIHLTLILTIALSSLPHLIVGAPLAGGGDTIVDVDPSKNCKKPAVYICVDKLDVRCGKKYGGC